MKKIINKIKSINKERTLILLIILISYYYQVNSLVASNLFYIVILSISFCIFLFLLFMIKLKVKSKITLLGKIVLYVFFGIYSILFIASYNYQNKPVITKLLYVTYTRYGTSITFRIDNKPFSRGMFLKEYRSKINPIRISLKNTM